MAKNKEIREKLGILDKKSEKKRVFRNVREIPLFSRNVKSWLF